MRQDTKSVISNKKDSAKNSGKKDAKKPVKDTKRRKNHESSDDDDGGGSEDEESEYDNEMDLQEYRKFLNKIFPSSHLDEKIKAKSKAEELVKSKTNKKNKIVESDTRQPSLKGGRERVPAFEEEEEEDDEEEEEDEEEDDEEEDEEEESGSEEVEKYLKPRKGKEENFNITFTIGGLDEDEYYDDEEDDEWESCSNSDTENEDDEISSSDDEDEEVVVKRGRKIKREDEDTRQSERVPAFGEDSGLASILKGLLNKQTKDKKQTVDKKKKDDKKQKEENIKLSIEEKVEAEKDTSKTDEVGGSDDCEEFMTLLKELQSKNSKNSLVNECLRVCEEKVKINNKKKERKERKEKDRNGRIFKKILRDKNTMNDFEFYDNYDTTKQKKIIKELREINKLTRIEKPYRLTLLESEIPVMFKSIAIKKIGTLRNMDPGSGEYYKIKNWVDTFMRIPFGEYKTLPVCIDDGIEVCHEFMASSQKILDTAVYGLNDAKMQIMQMLGQLITNPKAIGSSIAIHGPPGTGKTSLVKEGISKILNRPFAFIALGGATDSSFLEGHGYTYEGSTWGKIVQILIESKCMNPVIYFDELDKISDTPKGEEIAGILTHLTDTTQNSQFHDKYFSEIDFDLSKCLFIFSYNDESKINPILKDRMYRIETKGYNQKQKTVISNQYLLPKIREQIRFESGDVIIPDATLHYIIDNFCNTEDGVRNLKRCLEIVYTKLNLYRLMRPGSNLFEEDMSIKVEFPFTVTKDIVDKLVKKSGGLNPSYHHMYL